MEITEQWIGKAAGGRVFKEARTLLKMRKVIQVTRKEGVFQGTLDIGKRPMRVTVKVLGPNEVRNHCGCSMARRTGALCEHSTALMLASVLPPERMPGRSASAPEKSKAQVGKAANSVPSIPLEISIAPKFPAKGVRAVHLRRAEGVEPDQADQIFTNWLFQNIGQVDATMLSLPEDKIAGFYRALAGHTRIYRGDESMQVTSSRLRPVMEIEVDGVDARMQMLGEHLIYLGQAMAEWDEESGRLTVDLSDSEGGSNEGWQSMKTKALIKMLPALGEMYQLPDDLGGLEVRAAQPEIGLQISGSTRALQAQLSGIYPGGVQVPLALAKSGGDREFPIQDEENENLWWVRNSELEHAAAGELMRSGFQVLDASGIMFLRGEDAVLEFLTSRLPELRKKWSVTTEEKLAHVESKVERIVPKINIQGSGEDWLSCEVTWQCGDQELSGEAVRKLLMSGGRSMALARVVRRFYRSLTLR